MQERTPNRNEKAVKQEWSMPAGRSGRWGECAEMARERCCNEGNVRRTERATEDVDVAARASTVHRVNVDPGMRACSHARLAE